MGPDSKDVILTIRHFAMFTLALGGTIPENLDTYECGLLHVFEWFSERGKKKTHKL